MSYQVLARKWRPHTFEQVVGQQHVLTALTNALDQGRLHHAYLLSGTRGVGKTTIARILAKSLNCEQGISSTSCGVCDTCREIDQGNFVDLLEIDAASRTKVEDTRELLDNVQYRPARGRFKVYLIDEVHMLSRHSFNALLKTLEEPPPYVKFLLATTDPQKLPITILSRCLQFHLKSLDQGLIAKQLAWVLEQEGQPFEPRALQALAKAADGSMRDALSLTDQALAHGNGRVGEASVLAMLGTLDHHHLHQLLEAVLRQDAQATMAKIGEIATLGPDFDQLHAELEALLHRIALAQLLPASVQEQGMEADALMQLSKAMSPEEVQLCYQIVLGGRKDLPWAPDGRTALEMTCLRMLAFSPRRDPIHPASLGALPAQAGQGAAPLGLGKPQPAEPAPALARDSGAAPAPAPLPPAEEVKARPAQADASGAAVGDAAPLARPGESELASPPSQVEEMTGEALSPLFAEQEALLQAASEMGYRDAPSAQMGSVPAGPQAESPAHPSGSGQPPAPYPDQGEAGGLTPSMPRQGEGPAPQGMPAAADTALGEERAGGGIMSLLGTRNMLRSRLRASEGATRPATRSAAMAEGTAQRSLGASAKPDVAEVPAAIPSPAAPASSAAGETPWQGDWSYDVPSERDEGEGDLQAYQEYLAQGEPSAPVSALATPSGPRSASQGGREADSPPWDPDGPSTGAQHPVDHGAPAAPGAAPTPVSPPAQGNAAPARAATAVPTLETIDWNAIESEQEEEVGDEPSRLIPASLLASCGDPWSELIARTRVGGRLRQLAINAVMSQQEERVLLTLKPEQRHLVSDRALSELATIIGPELGREVRIEVTLGTVPEQETPLEIEHRLYLGVLEQAGRDLEQDPNVQFLRQRFGAELHMESIEPLNR
ncbi:DNA polymerase III subunit gamma/tau [Aeromonas bivalvium]|uniref:DNA polymerase III subunit gamma/tau n=1 Tax=Aeromonas bivalvium TaxID=440079 RepID=UPI0038D00470